MDALAVGAEFGGILGGIAIVAAFTIWVLRWREQTHKAVEKLNAQVADLQDTVRRQHDMEFSVVQGIANLNIAVEALQQDAAQLQEAIPAMRAGHEKMVVHFLDLKDQVASINKHVAQLRKGWVSLPSMTREPDNNP